MKTAEEWAEILRKQLHALQPEFDRRTDRKQLWLQVVAETFAEAMKDAGLDGKEKEPFTP